MLAYDAIGNVTSRTDFNNKKMCYAYDTSRNLETARAEGILTTETCNVVLATLPPRADVRKLSTQWHPIWRLPTRIAETNRLTTRVYNGDGGVYCAPTTALVSGNPIGVLCKQDGARVGPMGAASRASRPHPTGTPRVLAVHLQRFRPGADRDRSEQLDHATVYYAANDPDPGKRGNVDYHRSARSCHDLHGL